MGKVNIADWFGISNELFIFIVTVIAVIAFIIVNKIQKEYNSKKPVPDIEELGL